MRATVANISGNDDEEDYAVVSVLDRVLTRPVDRASERVNADGRWSEAAAKKASRTREYKTHGLQDAICATRTRR